MQRQQDIVFNVFKKVWIYVAVFVFVVASIPELRAQMFDFDETTSVLSDENRIDESAEQKQPFANRTPKKEIPARAMTTKKSTDSNKQNNIVVDKVQEVKPIDENEKIYMYMRDFSVRRNINGRVSCDMRFYLDSKVKEKITNISYRLKWPKIETALSFSAVEPQALTYVDYTLYGKGCYEMDSAPNIIVNRCRIKGRTQEHCASIIKWSK